MRRLRARLGQERDRERGTAGRELLGCVEANAEGRAHVARFEAREPGAMEKTVDVLVVRRYGKRGRSRSRGGRAP